MPFLRTVLLFTALSVFHLGANADERPNVLLLYIDDLRPQTSDYGNEFMQTPNFDRLAADGVRFENAYCQVPTCGASRASLFTSLYPTVERFPDFLTWAEKDAEGVKTLPQRFKEAGYTTISNGKIFHHREDTNDRSWSEPAWRPETDGRTYYNESSKQWKAARQKEFKGPKGANARKKDLMWEIGEADAMDTHDGLIAAKTMQDMQRLAADGKPFFIACGLAKPHMPFYSPQDTYEKYPLDQIGLAEHRRLPQPMPTGYREVREPFGYVPMTPDLSREVEYNSDEYHSRMRQGYYASVSHADDLMGRVFAKMEAMKLTDNTIVVVLGDHGWLLGEHNAWAKNQLLHKALRTALWMKGPGIAKGAAIPSHVEFVDIHPTLCELAGITIGETIHGRSFASLLTNPAGKHREDAYTRFESGDALTSDDYFYVRWSDASKGGGELLIDRKQDPLHKNNVSGQAAYRDVQRKLSDALTQRITIANQFQATPVAVKVPRKVETYDSALTSSNIDPRFLKWGDQHDGTYANPILNGDFADSDVEWDDENQRWVMITSTNHHAPGMTILESKDLVNWRYASHAIPSITWEPQYNWDQMNGYRWGCWAGDLVRHNGEWLCYQIDFQSGLYMTRSKSIEGPWSEPVCLLKRKHWTDPSVFFDKEKQEAWLVCNWGSGSPPRRDQPHEIRLFKLSWDGSKLLDEGHTIFSGTAVEAAKIRRFNDQWYLMLIEWQEDGESRDRRQLCLRSKSNSLYGPFDSRVVMQREKSTDRSACQGSLIEAPDGRWWFMHQLVQNGDPVFHGRPQCLQPVTWNDGWPIIGTDPDGDGIGVPVWESDKPIDLADGEERFQLQTSDEFDSEQLGHQWNWNHEPRASWTAPLCDIVIAVSLGAEVSYLA